MCRWRSFLRHIKNDFSFLLLPTICVLIFLTMFRFVRYRWLIFRYIILWVFLLTTVKLTSIFYYDLQQRTIDSSSSLPFDLKEQDPKSSNSSTIAEIKSANSSTPINRTAIDYYRQYVQRKNHEQYMYNSNLYSSNTTRYILLVQVHTRVVYLKKFIQMLHNVEAINQTLVIFSHDFIDPDINALVTNITFVPVKCNVYLTWNFFLIWCRREFY